MLKNLQKSPLLAPVLRGLSRFAHLINMDLLSNVLVLLKDLVADEKLSLSDSLNCIVTSFQTFKLQGETIEVDLKDFYAHFYKVIPNVVAAVSQHDELLPLMLEALDLMLTNKRQVCESRFRAASRLIRFCQFALNRTAAYIKRLLMSTLHASSNTIMSILKIVYDLLRARSVGPVYAQCGLLASLEIPQNAAIVRLGVHWVWYLQSRIGRPRAQQRIRKLRLGVYALIGTFQRSPFAPVHLIWSFPR